MSPRIPAPDPAEATADLLPRTSGSAVGVRPRTGLADPGAAETEAMPRVPPRRPGWRESLARYAAPRTVAVLGLLVVFACGYFLLCWVQSASSNSDADASSIALQGWDLWHHNKLLKGWVAADASFYTFETPLYALVEMVRGLSATTLHVVAALVYTLVMIAGAWLAKGGDRGPRALARAALTAAFLAVPLVVGNELTGTLLEIPDHIGTTVFTLLAFLLYSRVAPWKATKWCLLALLVVGQLGDATVKYVTVTSLVVVTVLRIAAARRVRIPETWLGLAAAASIPCAAVLRAAMRTWGAFAMVPPNTKVAPASAWLGHLGATGQSLLALFNITLSGAGRTFSFWWVGSLLGAAVLLAGIYGMGRTVFTWRRADAVDQLLTVGIPVYLAAFALSSMVQPGAGDGYEFPGVVPMIAVLAARNLPLPSVSRLPLVAGASALAALALLATDIKPAYVSPQEQLAPWLKAHGLTYGIAGYWDASSTTVASGNQVAVRAVVKSSPNQYGTYNWATNLSWYNPARHYADFFIAEDNTQGLTESDVESAYGKPSAIYQVAGFKVMVYPKNLLATLFRFPPPDN